MRAYFNGVPIQGVTERVPYTAGPPPVGLLGEVSEGDGQCPALGH